MPAGSRARAELAPGVGRGVCASEGLKLAKELRPTVITLDVMMPDIDGWSVMAALRQDAELAEIPSPTERWNDVPCGTMDEVSSHVRLDLSSH